MNKKTLAIRLLRQKKVDFDLLEYEYDPDNLDVSKIAKDNQLELALIFKTLVLKGDKSGLLIAVIPGDQQLSRKAVARISGNKKVNLLAVDQLEQHTGYVRGGCSPLALKKDLPVFIDKMALQYNKIWVNAGARGLLMGLAPKDLVNLSNGEIVNLC